MSPREHIEYLADALGVPIKYDERAGEEWASVNGLHLAEWGAWGNDEIQYGIALHELGHVALGHWNSFDTEIELRQETDATMWGLDRILADHRSVGAVSALLHSITSRLGFWPELEPMPEHFALARELGPDAYQPAVFAAVLPEDEIEDVRGAWQRLTEEVNLSDAS